MLFVHTAVVKHRASFSCLPVMDFSDLLQLLLAASLIQLLSGEPLLKVLLGVSPCQLHLGAFFLKVLSGASLLQLFSGESFLKLLSGASLFQLLSGRSLLKLFSEHLSSSCAQEHLSSSWHHIPSCKFLLHLFSERELAPSPPAALSLGGVPGWF